MAKTRKIIRVPYRLVLLIQLLVKYPLAWAYWCVFVAAALTERKRRRSRCEEKKPRILWGPVPIHATQYYSQACRRYGYLSHTLMYGRYALNAPEDFDYYPETLFPKLGRPFFAPNLYRYRCFLWAMKRYDVHFHNFDGGLLSQTPLDFYETRLWQMAGGKTVVYPYGGDAQVLRRLRSLLVRHTLMRDYPQIAKSESATERRLQHYTRHADFICAPVESVDYLPYWDLALMQMSAIDTDAISPLRVPAGRLRREYPDKKIIFHAPNHRHLKGTDLLVEACEALRREGRKDFELVIYERRANREVLEAMRDADIVADQFVLGTYAFFAIEAMALGKPVMCYLRPDLYEFYRHYSWGKECPVVDTPPDQIKELIIRLLDDDEERARLGRAGREFVERYHSLDGMGRIYDAIIRQVWYGTDEVSGLREALKSGPTARSEAAGVKEVAMVNSTGAAQAGARQA
jgi:glycosyltransferase involved in cell wall biosynthesis